MGEAGAFDQSSRRDIVFRRHDEQVLDDCFAGDRVEQEVEGDATDPVTTFGGVEDVVSDQAAVGLDREVDDYLVRECSLEPVAPLAGIGLHAAHRVDVWRGEADHASS